MSGRRDWDASRTSFGNRVEHQQRESDPWGGQPESGAMDEAVVGGEKAHSSRGLDECRRQGRDWRKKIPFEALAAWSAPTGRHDPVEILIEQGKSRIPELLPVRYARMRPDPFSFLRGAAAVMAADLGSAPATGLRLQTCGDCHLANLGGYSSPEGIPVFDINDFDETLPAPFEWDLKRLATSLVLAGRVGHLSERDCRRLARFAARDYRRRIKRLARLPPLDAWGSRIDLARAIDDVESGNIRRALRQRIATIMKSAKTHFGLVERRGDQWRIREKPPLVRHLTHHELHAKRAFSAYAATLQEDRRVLLDRYHLRDVALKVVGVGSVGTFCAIGLFIADDDAPLLLQIKEAQQSVLAPYAGASQYANHGERVVVGQRMLQAATDIFLGWTEKPVDGRYFYVRRLKDSRLADVGTRLEAALPFYAALCGRTVARAHARTGDAVALAAYIGDGNEFDNAIAAFALAYADQTEDDWHAFVAAIEHGRITAEKPAAPPPG
jgi:uncharacterized protein (DUF2252 family)